MITINVQFYRSSCIARIEGTDKRGIGGCVGDAVGALLVQYPDDFNVNLEYTGKQAQVEQPAQSTCAIANIEVDKTSQPKPQKQMAQQACSRVWQGGLRFAFGLGM